jgi:hypothetical protein
MGLLMAPCLVAAFLRGRRQTNSKALPAADSISDSESSPQADPGRGFFHAPVAQLIVAASMVHPPRACRGRGPAPGPGNMIPRRVKIGKAGAAAWIGFAGGPRG